MLRPAVLGLLALVIASPGLEARPASASLVAASERGRCVNGLDDDDDKKIDCADPDCALDSACLEARHCTDGVDNDGDGLVDCADDDCCGVAACLGAPACPETRCADGLDDDGDGPIDCSDSDCAGTFDCVERFHCTNGLDDDRDGFADCLDLGDCCPDPACWTAPGCTAEDCSDGADDDGDTLTDCDDLDCSMLCGEHPPRCTDGIDNDFDLLIDCVDPECVSEPQCSENFHCNDGLDNDLDGLTDCADLVDCCSVASCLGAPGCPERACANGVDDDLDGRIDCADPDCFAGDPACVERIHCTDGLDNDLDGLVDCADRTACCAAPACAGAPGCPESDCANGVDDDFDGPVDCEDSDCDGDPACTCVAGDFDAPDGYLALPLTSCQTIDGFTCESRAIYRVVLDPGRTYTFTFCSATCAGAGAGFDSQLALISPEGGTVAFDDRTCGDDAQIRFTTDPVDGGGLYGLRVTNAGGGGRRFTLGWFVDCVPPASLLVSPPIAHSESAACLVAQLVGATVSGTGGFDWTWSILPPATGSASPSTGTVHSNLGSLEIESDLSGAGDFTVVVEAANACGTTLSTHVLRVLDRAAPDAEGLAAPCAGAPFAPPRMRRSARAASIAPCASPCTGGVLAQAGDYFDVFLRCDDGAFTARTGALHPATIAAGAPRDILYGGAAGRPGTSEIAWRVHDVAGTWSNPPGGEACAFDPPDTAREPSSAGLAEEWTIEPRPGVILHLREEIVAFGTSAADAGLRLTLSAANDAASTGSAAMGLRFLLDHQNAADDGPALSSVWCDPTTVGPSRTTEHELLAAEIGAQALLVDDDAGATLPVRVSTSHLNGFDDTRTPDRLLFAGWERARLSPWDHAAIEGDAGAASDSALMAWFGATTATSLTIAPGESVSRSLILTSGSDVLDCDRVAQGTSTDSVTTVCADECADVGATGFDGCGGVSVRLVASSPGAPPCAAPGCSATFPVPGTHEYEWEIVDDAGHATRARSTVIVLDPTDPSCNQPPACVLGTPAPGTCRTIVVDAATAEDPDADDLTWTWTSSSPDVTVVPATGVIGGAPGAMPLPAVDAILAPGVDACGAVATLTLTLDDGRAPAVTCTTTVTFDDNDAPALAGVPPAARVACDAVPAPAPVSATDTCDAAPGLAFSERIVPGACADAWTIERTWTATDACGNATSATQLVDVVDDAAPTLLGVPANATVDCAAIPAAPLVTATDSCDPAPALTLVEILVPGACPGSYQLLRDWTATDRCGSYRMERQTLTVVDTTPPTIAPSEAVVACLWPANHRMACFGKDAFAPVIHDDCSEPVTWRLAGCVSSQPDDGRGDGATDDDCVASPDGTSICVRAERAGSEPLGRFYRVSIVAVDACGNESAPVVVGRIEVPHDRARREGCVRAGS